MNVLVSVFANWPEVSKCSYHDLTQGRVNRLRPGKREKVLLPGIHHIDELLDQDGRMGTNDVSSQDPACLSVHDHFDESVLLAHGISLDDIVVLLHANQDIVALLRLLLCHANRGDLRVRKHRVRNGVLIYRMLVLRAVS